VIRSVIRAAVYLLACSQKSSYEHFWIAFTLVFMLTLDETAPYQNESRHSSRAQASSPTWAVVFEAADQFLYFRAHADEIVFAVILAACAHCRIARPARG
jgi:hypothetical protein